MKNASRNHRLRPQWLALVVAFGLLALVAGFEAGAATVGVVNVNTASAAELELLPGVGSQRAAAIIATRKSKGSFSRPEDLLEVEGIGAVMLERMRPYVALKGGTTARRAESGKRSKK
ncbi:MAG: helix-hairpin-helix domain-containing protein [Myxococcota bacterium]|jgi:competence protein ComEA|nr:helix-hairpin-helix domain-containing protein [Myxococcota bacterium]